MEAILGIFPHELTGRFEKWISLIHPDDRADYRREVQRVLTEGGPFEIEYRALKRSDKYTLLLERGYFISPAQGASPVMSSMISDVSDLRELESRVRKSQRVEAFGQLTGGVAHDFNNMLSVVIGYSQILMEEAGDDEERLSFLREIEKAALRASSLTNQLLAFSKPPAIRRGSINIGELLNDVVKMLRRLLGEQIELVIDIEPGLPVVQADRSQIEQVFINLAVAAREVMSQGGQLKIHVARDVVQDARRIAQKSLPPGNYARVSLTYVPKSSRGVSKTLEKNRNIATAAEVIEENEGRLEIPSAAHGLSRLDLFLPSAQEAPPKADIHTVGRTTAPATILLVEDDSAIRSFARTVLQRLGHHVVEAEDGETALSYFEDNEAFAPDLVFTDMVMPRMGGLQLARKIEKKWPETTFLLTSGYPDQQEIAKEHETDFAFLRKPFSVGDLISKVGSLLEGRVSQQ
jgi:CheY-like chemotaxis protein